MTQIELTTNTLTKLVEVTQLLGQTNTLIARMINPYLITYLLEEVEAVASNEVENIHSTYDEAQTDFIIKNNHSPYVRYRETLKQAHRRLKTSKIIKAGDILWINASLRALQIGFRKTPVTINDSKGNVVHRGADANEIPALIAKLCHQINKKSTQNPIIRALLIHHQFEKIHPFTDGNGRTGRILLAIMLVQYQVLDVPASVFSYSVAKNKTRYYKALRAADEGNINYYLAAMLDILVQSLQISIAFITNLQSEYNRIKGAIKNDQQVQKNLLALLPFCFTGVKINTQYLVRKSKLNNKTVTKYLQVLINWGVMEQEIKGKYRPYKNLILERLINSYFKQKQ